MRLLGVDFGFKRIGIAVGESEVRIASPRHPLAASGALKKDAAAIAASAKSEEVDAVVIGLPVEESGNEGRMARICRSLADHLREDGLAVYFVDERYSSVQAELAMANAGLSVSEIKQRKDGEAACLILERYFDGETTD